MSPVNRTPNRTIRVAWFTLLLAGCVTLTATPTAPWELDDPPQLSPRNRSLKIPDTEPTPADPQPVPAEAAADEPTTHTDGNATPPPIEFPTSPGSEKQRDRQPAETPSGPRISPQAVIVPAKLELAVKTPPRKQVGNTATFQLTVRNIGDEPAENVIIESEFDEALIFPGRKEKKVRQVLGRLAAQQSKQIALTLLSDAPGRHCCRFTVTSLGLEAVWKSVCVEYVE